MAKKKKKMNMKKVKMWEKKTMRTNYERTQTKKLILI